jgi:hypothetical protein
MTLTTKKGNNYKIVHLSICVNFSSYATILRTSKKSP